MTKPRLRHICGAWVCVAPALPHTAGTGATPAQAYDSWLNVLLILKPAERKQ